MPSAYRQSAAHGAPGRVPFRRKDDWAHLRDDARTASVARSVGIAPAHHGQGVHTLRGARWNTSPVQGQVIPAARKRGAFEGSSAGHVRPSGGRSDYAVSADAIKGDPGYRRPRPEMRPMANTPRAGVPQGDSKRARKRREAAIRAMRAA